MFGRLLTAALAACYASRHLVVARVMAGNASNCFMSECVSVAIMINVNTTEMDSASPFGFMTRAEH